MVSASLQLIVLAGVSVQTFAQTQTGMPTCQCVGKIPSDLIVAVPCNYDFAFNGNCVEAKTMKSNFTFYPADYGHVCKTHKEPGQSGCFDLSTNPPKEKAIGLQASWCASKWCYVDPCNCDASDVTGGADYFGIDMPYSYSTCGEKNTYTATEDTSHTVGDAVCASDAQSLKFGLGLLFAVMGALA